MGISTNPSASATRSLTAAVLQLSFLLANGDSEISNTENDEVEDTGDAGESHDEEITFISNSIIPADERVAEERLEKESFRVFCMFCSRDICGLSVGCSYVQLKPLSGQVEFRSVDTGLFISSG